jgi:hypothetical protein
MWTATHSRRIHGERGEGEGGGSESDGPGEDSGSNEAPAPTELARSLSHHRPELQQIRRKLHGHGSTNGITSMLTALLTSGWIAVQVVRADIPDPA